MHQQVGEIQMGTHDICLYKEVDKKYTGCNLKTMELLDYALVEACAIIRSNSVSLKCLSTKKNYERDIFYQCFG